MTSVKACVLRVGGTNCDMETKIALEDLGLSTDIIHMNQLLKGRKRLEDYHLLVIPGGFSYGDYVRAGAIWGKKLASKLRKDLEVFIEEDKAVVGICNGFQVLVESGILPNSNGLSDYPKITLTTNVSARYECRWTYIKYHSSCKLLSKLKDGTVLRIPVGHAEGRFMAPKEVVDYLVKSNLITFTYCKPDGSPANGEYPYNPNGSILDIAGICNLRGNVMGMMPHPERAYFGWQMLDWTRNSEPPQYGDGRLILESIVEYVKKL
ncbi:MAG: phosphoribosylformylglycinamidine synthase subunit PurQ [Candidatus Nezhaarchaeota archaeon]|nr:phosphoribosylformylglycinamidine synthase subunit PurQ [Candidatus Nezhaarchaeota archaeon]MCX8141623.1 phosphoribosylformylglycinamidine synthase subunit PurQ [Candidatus Nezhaarchaeota archaeon]MDW8049890.1 phosphoribosylformylglycinamidine synthase subunit PurQ [Nitrososphaerota archaeon]